MASLATDLHRPATYADLEALPAHIKGEIIDGALYTQPRPRMRPSRAGLALSRIVSGPYDFEARGPDAWWILIEPGIELPGATEIAPDIGGWQRSRLKRRGLTIRFASHPTGCARSSRRATASSIAR